MAKITDLSKMSSVFNNKTIIGGLLYTPIGESTSPLLLKSNGNVKILYGGSFIDLLKDGKINTSSNIIKNVDSEDKILTDGIYIFNNDVIIRSHSKNYSLINSNTSSDKLKELGLIAKTIDDISIKQGIVYVINENKVYKVNNGMITPLESGSTIVLESSKDIAERIVSVIKSSVTIGETITVDFSKDYTKFNTNVKFGNNSGILLSNNGVTTLTVDNLIWRNQPITDLILTDPIYSSFSNIIIDYNYGSYTLKYDNKFNVGDNVIITYDEVPEIKFFNVYETINIYRIILLVENSNAPNVYQYLSEDGNTQFWSLEVLVKNEFNLETKELYIYYDLNNNEYTWEQLNNIYTNISIYNVEQLQKSELVSNKLNYYVTSSTILPIEYQNDIKIENTEGILETEVPKSYFINLNLKEDSKERMKALSNNILIDKVTYSSGLKIAFEEFAKNYKNFFVYCVKDYYISIIEGTLRLLDINKNLYFLIGDYERSEYNYHSYSSEQLLDNPTLNNPIIIGTTLYNKDLENPDNYELVNVKYVNSLINSESNTITNATQQALELKANTSLLSKVAFSNVYNDLLGVPTKVSLFENDENYLTDESLNDYYTKAEVDNLNKAITKEEINEIFNKYRL